MKTRILETAIRLLVPLFQVFSLYILFRGHNHPGGGFIGGLIGSIGFIFYAMVYGPKQAVHTFLNIRLFIEDKTSAQNEREFDYQAVKIHRQERDSPEHGAHEKPTRVLRIEPMYLMATGLLLSAGSGMLGMLSGLPYMSAVWADFYLPILGKPGTPILFDLGVYLLVLGVIIKITFIMSED